MQKVSLGEKNLPKNDCSNNMATVFQETLKGIEFLPQTQIPIFSQPAGLNLLNFKLRLFIVTEFKVLNIKGLRHWLQKYSDLKN